MKRVLVVDDKEENLYYLKALFVGSGWKVETVRNGAEALETARAVPPDLVVSDLLMPVMDGYSLLREWKRDARLNQVPFIVYTATYTGEEDERLAVSLGADAFMVKPAEPDAILATVKEVEARVAVSGPALPTDATAGADARLEAYNQVLVRKLEDKMCELEEVNRQLELDLVERVKRQEQLERASALLRLAGRVAQLGGWALRLPERELTWSDETCAIHDRPEGYRPTLDEGIAYYVPADRERIGFLVETCIAEGQSFDVESQVVTATGRRIWVRAIGEAVRDDHGAVVRVQGAFQDITGRKLLEQQSARHQRMESISTLTGGMAHDLNNVLAPILLALEVLEEDVESEDSAEMLATALSCARRGADMVQQVLSFARGIDRPGGSVDFGRIVGELGKVVRETFPGSIELEAALPGDLWGLEGDATQLYQLLMNLFTNARDAMPDGGRLTITAENVQVDQQYAAMSGQVASGRYVRISVVDTGVGMSAEVRDRIFDPLFTTKPEGRGTGLGLSTVAAIIENHRGFLHVYSEEGVGTTFRLHIPAAEGGDATDAVPALDQLEGRGEVVLVVDDEGAVRTLTQQTLEAFGYSVLIAADGREAIEVYRQRGPEIDLVLTDLGMPGLDGAATIRALRELDVGVKVIAASGVGQTAGDGRAVAAGVKHFLAKPYTAEALLSTIGRALSE